MMFFFSVYSTPPDLHSFPTRRSSDLILKVMFAALVVTVLGLSASGAFAQSGSHTSSQFQGPKANKGTVTHRDRKSTRLNSSHRCISYAVFCLKKKKRK